MDITALKGLQTMNFKPDQSSRLATGALALFLLASCGGGGDDPPAATSPAANDPPAPSAAVAPVTTTAPAPDDGANAEPVPPPAPESADEPTANCGLGNFAADALARINRLRATGATCGSQSYAPTTALTWNARLNQAGEAHSQDMATLNYFSHTSADGRTLVERINASGYAWSMLGENIAAGYSTVDRVMDGWTQSPGHCANLMNPNFSEVGLACIPGTPSSRHNTYWTMDLGRPR